MSEQQKKNLVVFLVVMVGAAWLIHKQLIAGVIRKRAVLLETIGKFGEKVANCNGAESKTQNLETDVEAAKATMESILKQFPDEAKDLTSVSACLDKAPGDLPNVNIVKAPPLTKRPFSYRAKSLPVEDIQVAYKNMILEGSGKPLDPPTIIPTTISCVRLDQSWEIEADWDGFLKFLTKLGTLQYYFEITSLDVVGKRGGGKVKESLIVSAVSFLPEGAKTQ